MLYLKDMNCFERLSTGSGVRTVRKVRGISVSSMQPCAPIGRKDFGSGVVTIFFDHLSARSHDAESN